MKTNTIQTMATVAVVLTLGLGVLGTTPSTTIDTSHTFTSETAKRSNFKQPDWAWLLKQPTRIDSVK